MKVEVIKGGVKTGLTGQQSGNSPSQQANSVSSQSQTISREPAARALLSSAPRAGAQAQRLTEAEAFEKADRVADKIRENEDEALGAYDSITGKALTPT